MIHNTSLCFILQLSRDGFGKVRPWTAQVNFHNNFHEVHNFGYSLTYEYTVYESDHIDLRTPHWNPLISVYMNSYFEFSLNNRIKEVSEIFDNLEIARTASAIRSRKRNLRNPCDNRLSKSRRIDVQPSYPNKSLIVTQPAQDVQLSCQISNHLLDYLPHLRFSQGKNYKSPNKHIT